MQKFKRESIKKLGLLCAWSTPLVQAVSLPAHAQTSQAVLFDSVQVGLGGFTCSSTRPRSIDYFFDIELTLNNQTITDPSLDGLEIEVIFNALENERVFLATTSIVKFNSKEGSAFYEIVVADRIDFAQAQISVVSPTSGETVSVLDGFDIEAATGGGLTC